MAVNLVTRLAAAAPVPVFCLAAGLGREVLRTLRLDRRLRLVDSPRHAAVLVVAGDIPKAMEQAAGNVYDQVPEPRGVVLWECRNGEDIFGRHEAVIHSQNDRAIDSIVTLFGDMVNGSTSSSPLQGPAESPVQWQGKGDHGQGGEGMMGGVPYGRPMGMTAGDLRDGLSLGSSTFSLGPFLPWMPPGLRLSLTLQGDVIQQLEWKAAPLSEPDMEPVFRKAVDEPVLLAEIERARARHHLRSLSDLFFLLQLDDYGRHALQIAGFEEERQLEMIRRLERKLGYTGFFRWSLDSSTTLPAKRTAGLGFLARATARKEDARLEDPSYTALDFKAVTEERGSTAALVRLRFRETIQSLELARRAGARQRHPDAPLEGPRGIVGKEKNTSRLDLLADVAPGMAWDAFVTLLVSLDLDCAGVEPADDFDSADYQDPHDEDDSENGHAGHDH